VIVIIVYGLQGSIVLAKNDECAAGYVGL